MAPTELDLSQFDVSILPTTWRHLNMPIEHMRVRRVDGGDGITWDELQAIKNAVVGEERAAFEVFPPDAQLVYSENVRHLWVLPPDADADMLPTLWW